MVGWTRGCGGGEEDEDGVMRDSEARLEWLIPVKWRRAKYFVSADFRWLAGDEDLSNMVTSLSKN